MVSKTDLFYLAENRTSDVLPQWDIEAHLRNTTEKFNHAILPDKQTNLRTVDTI